jgi:hypothetical protein
LDSAWRYLDLEICPGSKIRGEARILESGWPAPVLGNCSSTPKIRAAPALRPQLTGTVCPAPPVFSNRYMYFSFFLRLGNSESWKVETAITLPVLHVCTFPARERPSQRCKAPGARNGLARARVAAARAAGGSASRRSTLASSPHRLLRGALKVALLFTAAVTFSAVMAWLRRHFRTIGFARRLPSQQAQERHRQWLAL